MSARPRLHLVRSAEDDAPVLVGLAQVEQRIDDPGAAAEPLELMERAVRAALEDCGAPAIGRRLTAVCVNQGAWRYADPARWIAEQVGAPDATRWMTRYGGHMVQYAVNRAARAIQSGEQAAVLLTGAETGRTRARARRAGLRRSFRDTPGEPDERLGDELPMVLDFELERGIGLPIQVYALFESAIRSARGEGLEEHRDRIARLWAGFSRVAAGNPNAWIRQPVTPEQLRTPTPDNRMIGFPYTKLMNSNSHVDQGAALLLCSVATARRAGVPRDRWIHLHAGADASDHAYVSWRDRLHESPAIRIAGARCLELAGLDAKALEHVDLYSCFPSAVQVAAGELGLPLERPLTVTGGLTFGGGPLNNYGMHGIARMGEVLRAHPGARGLVTGNGGLLTKHSFGVYSTDAPDGPFRHASPQGEIDELPRRSAAPDWTGEVEIEATTVMVGGEGPERGFAACLLDDGRRTWAHTRDPERLHAMTHEPVEGRRGRIDGDGVLTF